MLVSRTAYCGETDENIEQTPKAQQKQIPFYCLRGVKAVKRKAKTETARAELCKRCLFPSNKNKENKCGRKNEICTSRQHHSGKRGPGTYDINTRVPLGAINSGIGYTHINSLFTELNIPTINRSAYK